MAVDGIDTSQNAPSTTPSAFSNLNSEDFVKIIFAELAHQDPLKPNDSNQMIQQMANLRSIQADIDLTSKLQTLVTENQLASAGNLMGTHITGLDQDFNDASGIVISITRTADGPVLNLHTGQRVPLRNVQDINIDPRLLEDPTNPTDPTTPTNPTNPTTPTDPGAPGTGTFIPTVVRPVRPLNGSAPRNLVGTQAPTVNP